MTMRNIERDLGPEWPKRLYPHGGGREWSTSHHDDTWKLPEAFEVVPADDYRGVVRASETSVLRAIVEQARGGDDWVSGHDLIVRVGAIVLDRLRAAGELPDA